MNLSKLVNVCKEQLIKQLISEDELKKALANFDLSDLLCSNAERKSYGIRDKDSILYECESFDALWSWELTNTLLLPLPL